MPRATRSLPGRIWVGCLIALEIGFFRADAGDLVTDAERATTTTATASFSP